MNEGMLQDGFLDQEENWLPASVAETGGHGGGAREEQQGRRKEEAELFHSRSTGSSSSGSESPGMASSEAGSHGLESDGSSDGNAGVPDKPRGSTRTRSNVQAMRMIQEMRRHLSAERPEGCGKAGTLCTLQYALKCVRQIQDSRAFQAFGAQGVCRADATSYSLEELAAMTSEHVPRNTDTFVAVFSLLSGRIVHLSNQAAAVLNCKKKILDSSCFAELLAPQDLGTFYSHLSQSHLPLWNMESQTASLFEYAQVRPFFCRLGGGGDRGPEERCRPFRITPYLVNICASEDAEPEPCCLALAEKIHSGYEAPRIPLEKRIFTTKHTPGCVFLEIDDRAVPLLGYLPQDLAGTSILMYLHPEDRPLMVAVHRKVLRFAGQPPFEHSPIRFCTRNGDYVTLDTSWSSFVNPWSRKVVFVIGRHKVRTSPLNEDVFATRSRETKRVDREVWELQGQIYKMLLQPVHSNSSSGYGSLLGSGSYEHYISVASSSDSNGNCVEEPREPVTLQQASVNVSRQKNVGQQQYIASHSQPLDKGHGAPGAKLPRGDQMAASRLARAAPAGSRSHGEPPVVSGGDGGSGRHHLLSYQQINCVDGIIRYLEGCSVPALKRKCSSSANASSSSADDDDQAWPSNDEALVSGDASGLYPTTTSQPKGEAELRVAPQVTMLGAPVRELAMAAKTLSMGSVTSYSSTLVHFPHPESEATVLEDPALLAGGEAAELPPANAPCAAPATEEEEEEGEKEKAIRPAGLTTEVLSAHTQKEEQNYVDRFCQRVLLPPYKSYLRHRGARSPQALSQDHDFPSKQTSPESWRRTSKQGKFKRQKPQASPESSPCGDPEKFGTAQRASPAPSIPAPGFAPVAPSCLPCGLQPLPALPTASAGSMMAVFFPAPPPAPLRPFCPTWRPPCPPSPCLGTATPASPPSSTAPPPTDLATARHPWPPSAPLWPEEEPPEVSEEGQDPPPPQPLFSHSRSSSPLQLDLLQEELPKPPELPGQAPMGGSAEPRLEEMGGEGGHADSHSVSSELLDLLLLENSKSASGSSAESLSLVSVSNGTSGCGPGSRNSSSGYLASNDSSEVSKRGRGEEEGEGRAQPASPRCQGLGKPRGFAPPLRRPSRPLAASGGLGRRCFRRTGRSWLPWRNSSPVSRRSRRRSLPRCTPGFAPRPSPKKSIPRAALCARAGAPAMPGLSRQRTETCQTQRAKTGFSVRLCCRRHRQPPKRRPKERGPSPPWNCWPALHHARGPSLWPAGRWPHSPTPLRQDADCNHHPGLGRGRKGRPVRALLPGPGALLPLGAFSGQTDGHTPWHSLGCPSQPHCLRAVTGGVFPRFLECRVLVSPEPLLPLIRCCSGRLRQGAGSRRNPGAELLPALQSPFATLK